MTVRKWLAAVGATAVTGFGTAPAADSVPAPAKPAPAADPVPVPAKPAPAAKAVLAFGAMRAMPEDAAKAKVAAWLKAEGKLDAAKFDAAWAEPGRSMLDRVVAAAAIARPELVDVLANARRADAPIPTELPAALKDAKLDPFVRANFAAAYARALAGRRVYEEALEAAKGVPAEQLVDPAGFYFYKAVAEHALIQREATVASIARLLDDVADAPDRYRVTATLLFFDVQSWPKDDKDLSVIGKLMDNSERRLELARGGPKTQEIQKKIVFRLDEKIKEMEAKAKQQQGGGGGGGGGPPNEGQCPSGGQTPGGGGPSNNPMADSQIATNGGKGQVDEKKLRHYEKVWGTLPDAERKKVVQEISRDLPAKYKPMIEDYFRALNRLHGFKP